jgi:choice-of-anchor B domain-containing protein
VGSGGYVWRDIKTYKHYAYAVSEATGTYSGISVIDMSYLPDSAHYIGSFSTNGGTGFTSHNLSIDTVKGFAYLEGDATQKVRILSLANPENPTFVNFFGTSVGQIHDVYAYNDTVWVAEGSAGTWSIWNLANKAAPQMLVRVGIPASGYVHNIWPSADHKYCVTTEETAGKTIKVWDISNLASIQLIADYLAPSQLAHNTHWFGNFQVNSHYESGVQLVDVSDPANPVELDRVDTYPASESPAFNGCWGAYPFTKNGYVYASTIEGRLWVLSIVPTCPTAAVPLARTPANGATSVDWGELIAWSHVGADSYQLQVDDDPAFGSPELDLSQADTSTQVNSALSYTTTYYWRVRSINGCGESAWSVVRSFTTGCVIAITGDVDVSGRITASDLIALVAYVFKSGAAPQPVVQAGDANCSGAVSAEDVIYLVNYVFKSGPAPCDACSLL